MKEHNCIFCKIADGEIPSATIYEDEEFRAFLDLNPASRGHALIVPKEHFANLFEMDEEHLKKLIVLAQRIGKYMKEKLGCDGLNLVQNNGEAAGQTVFHFHLHLIPRYKDDGVGITWKPGSLTPEDKEELTALLSQDLPRE